MGNELSCNTSLPTLNTTSGCGSNTTACGGGLGDGGSTPLWVIGVLFSTISSLATAVGTLLQKKAHKINSALEPERRAREFIGLLLSPTWLFAFFLMVLLPLPFDFVANAYAAQSLLVPLAGVTIAASQLLAPVLLKEVLSWAVIRATFVIIVGVVLSTSTGSHAEQEYDACSLLALYTRIDTFVLPVLLLGGAIGVALALEHGCLGEATVVLGRWRPATLAFLAGGFGALNNLVFKATGELAFSSDKSHWSTVHPYYHIALVVVLATLQISHINHGLKDYDAVFYLPLYNCFFIVCTSTLGAIFFGEFVGMSVMRWVLFPLGVGVTLIGIVLMSSAERASATKCRNGAGATIAPDPGSGNDG